LTDDAFLREVRVTVATLTDYFALRDGADPMSALDLLAEDVRYHLMPAPGMEISGGSREALHSALEDVQGPLAKHHIVTSCESAGLQFTLGHRVLDDKVLGSFIAAAVTNQDGLLSTYFGAYFDGSTVVKPAESSP
jgi:hypothetical protein